MIIHSPLTGPPQGQLINAAINVMPHPTQYGDGGDAVGI